MSIDWNKPVQLRDGRPARVICTNRKGYDRPIVALVDDGAGCERPVSYRRDGRLLDDTASSYDIINVPERVERWINLYPAGVTAVSHYSKHAADSARNPGCTGLLKITFEGDKPVAVELAEGGDV